MAAIRRAETFCGTRPWFLKMDIRRYFPNIDHEVLLGLLEQKIKDPDLLRLFRRIVSKHQRKSARAA